MLSPRGAPVSHPGEGRRKEVADPLGLGICLMDDLERIWFQRGIASFALEALMSSVSS